MRQRRSRYYLISVLLTFAVMALLWPLDCFASKEAKAIKRIGRHLERIDAIDRRCRLKNSSTAHAAVALFAEVEAMQKAALMISDTAKIKAPLDRFFSTWTSAVRIQASMDDGRERFMADATGFYLQGLVERREGWKTLFPFFRP